MPKTIVQYLGEQNRSRCGYCGNTNSSNSHGMHAYMMTPQDYQDLIDRGWRRSGDYCYKPNNTSTCCPSYTIRCNVHEFKLSKSQKKVLKRMNRFLQNGIKDKEEMVSLQGEGEENLEGEGNPSGQNLGVEGMSREEPDIPKVTLKEIEVIGLKEEAPFAASSSAALSQARDAEPNLLRNQQQPGDKRRDEAKSTDSQEINRPPCKKAKQMRLERRQAKLAAKGITEDTTKSKAPINQEKSLSEYINEVIDNPRHKLTVVIVPSNKGVTKPVLELYRKYQCTVHKDPPQKITQKSYERFLVRTPLQLKLVEVSSVEFQENLSVTFGLYKKYQTIIHNDPSDNLEDFLYFLQNSPLQHTKTSDGPEQGYGSFHQQYWLDDRLIAVGVIDILPYCVSSVYFFYDPEYNFLSLGTYGSLREIYLTNLLSEKTPALRYYYMGFYIHSCQKMRYKGRLSASYLLCPEVYSWHLLTDEIREKLNKSKYERLNPDLDAIDNSYFHENDLDAVLILFNRSSYMTYRNYVQSMSIESVDQVMDFLRRTLNLEAAGPDGTQTELLEYGQLVGRVCAHRMLYVR